MSASLTGRQAVGSPLTGAINTFFDLRGRIRFGFVLSVQLDELCEVHTRAERIFDGRTVRGKPSVVSCMRRASRPSRSRMKYEAFVDFVSAVEFVGGSLLTVGFLSSPACVALLIDMLVATLTISIPATPKGLSPLSWLGDFLYFPEALYVLFFIWLLCLVRESSVSITGLPANY